MSDAPTCPECGADWARSGQYFAVVGELSHLSPAEAADKYYNNRSEYRDDAVRKYRCGNVEIVEETA